jgi:hypothetical protein
MCRIRLVMLLSIISLPLKAADSPKPVVPGPEGQRAFDELATHYSDQKQLPSVREAFDLLKSEDDKTRQKAGEFLLALFRQSFADEGNGRAPWQKQPYFGGGSSSPARELRKHLAETFGKTAEGESALDAALWLVDTERLPDNQVAGITVLRRIPGLKANEALKKRLSPPHPSVAVAIGIVEEVGKRKLKECAAEVLALCGHHRAPLRSAAKKVAETLELRPIPPFDPEKAFTPRLEKQLTEIARMVTPTIPTKARWVAIYAKVDEEAKQKDRKPISIGWLIEDADGHRKLVDWFGAQETLQKEGIEIEDAKLTDTADRFRAIRSAKDDGARDSIGALSRRGMLSAQFQPRFISLPEILVGAWAFERGDRKMSAAVLFERIDEMRDDRWLIEVARDQLGHQYHQDMLSAFSYHRDYDRTLVLAKHLAKEQFEGYAYHSRAKNLAKQLPRRMDDFKAFKLPTPAEWKEQQGKLKRAEQIDYLAKRLRLLNCQQWGQPGGVNYEDLQNSEPFAGGRKKGVELINPVVELEKLNLDVADLPVLIPFLGDDDYMLVFSYWRDFHPDRTLHQVNWIIVGLVNHVAAHDLADFASFVGQDEQGRKAHLDKLIAWSKENAGKSRVDLLRQIASKSENWQVFERAAAELVAKKDDKVMALLIERAKSFRERAGAIAEWCAKLNSADAVKPAREWVEGGDSQAKFWGALILLRHGDKAKKEGLAPLKAVLEKDDGSYLYPRAIEPLLEMRTEDASALAAGILKKEHFRSDHNRGEILRRLFVAGRSEALDYALAVLDRTESRGSASGTYMGKEVRREQSDADGMAKDIADWRTDEWSYDMLAPDEERKKNRDQLKAWLKDQSAKVKKGEKTAISTENRPLHFPQWRIDAP